MSVLSLLSFKVNLDASKSIVEDNKSKIADLVDSVNKRVNDKLGLLTVATASVSGLDDDETLIAQPRITKVNLNNTARVFYRMDLDFFVKIRIDGSPGALIGTIVKFDGNMINYLFRGLGEEKTLKIVKLSTSLVSYSDKSVIILPKTNVMNVFSVSTLYFEICGELEKLQNEMQQDQHLGHVEVSAMFDSSNVTSLTKKMNIRVLEIDRAQNCKYYSEIIK